jgi:hypothetical protein
VKSWQVPICRETFLLIPQAGDCQPFFLLSAARIFAKNGRWRCAP